jgi:FlaA1/EpsC-like NDP-sugar epimerase
VLLTGAAGSLGTALARRLAALPLRQLVLADTSEHGLVQLQRRIDARDPTPQVTYRLADLRLPADRDRLLRDAPTVILHTAAYKHVPFLERRPIAAAQNNLLATADWLSACRAHAAPRRFVFVSTDKAVRPTSVMGATKAAAEQVLRTARAHEDGASEHQTGLVPAIVRLCNIFGSRGSVVPRFCRHLRAGEPLPVTHPEAERWFISADGAARSVLHALRHGGGTYVPAAARSVPIYELARRLVRWHRPDADPADWIRRTGLRAGERLRERRLAKAERPGHPVEGGLVRARSRSSPVEGDTVTPEPTPGLLDASRIPLDRIRQLCADGATEAVHAAVMNAAAELGATAGK